RTRLAPGPAGRPYRARRSSIVSRRWRSDFGNADHRIAGDQRGELLFSHRLGTSRTLGQNQIAQLGGAVPDAHFDILRQLDAELAKDAARVDDRARAIGR